MRHDGFRSSNSFLNIDEDYPYLTEVNTLKELGIIKGDGYGNLKPKEYITREKAILLFYRMIKSLNN